MFCVAREPVNQVNTRTSDSSGTMNREATHRTNITITSITFTTIHKVYFCTHPPRNGRPSYGTLSPLPRTSKSFLEIQSAGRREAFIAPRESMVILAECLSSRLSAAYTASHDLLSDTASLYPF